MKKSTISRLVDQKHKPFRLGFTRYLVEQYGMSASTAYPKIRTSRFRKWETVGISDCIALFSPEYSGEAKDFYNSLPDKGSFQKFMSEKMGMGGRTVSIRFRAFDFSEVEMKGLNNIYKEYMEQLED